MNVVTRIIPAKGNPFLVVIEACGSCFYDPAQVQDRITRGTTYQNPKTRILHSVSSYRHKTYCGRDVPREHEADVEVQVK